MTPRLAMHDVPDVRLVDAISPRELSPRRSLFGQSSDLQHLTGIEFGSALSFSDSTGFGMRMHSIPTATRESFWMNTSRVRVAGSEQPTGGCVLRVLSGCGGVEVGRVDAPFVVAGMANREAVWNGSIRQDVGDAMGETGSSGHELPVAVTQHAARPQPAIARLVDFGPEPVHADILPVGYVS